jgi:alkanesulfonate monooxygenase SsuD/methylene tetrahydromethanopterin reductase-like flavin-dependent oxidoreductase (luciferase family)
MSTMPAVSLAAVPGRRLQTLALARTVEERGFSGIYCPSFGDGMGLCEALAFETKHISFGTTIANIYARHPLDYAQSAAFIHEVSAGRFRFGIGVSHGPTNQRLEAETGRPLSDIRHFSEKWTAGGEQLGGLPPLMLATLRRKMVELSSEISQGAVWANAARSHMPASLAHLTPAQRGDPGFTIANMVPTCITDDREAAANVMRRTLTLYVTLPNYQNYWIEAGYGDEMHAIKAALAAGDREKIPGLMSDRWLSDVTLFGSAAEVRAGVDAWEASGVNTLILVPSSATGGQLQAFDEVFAAFR